MGESGRLWAKCLIQKYSGRDMLLAYLGCRSTFHQNSTKDFEFVREQKGPAASGPLFGNYSESQVEFVWNLDSQPK